MNPRPANDFVPTNVEYRERMLEALADDSIERDIERARLIAAEYAQQEPSRHYRRVARRAKWLGRFGFANRAADASHSSLLRVSTIGGIAIAVFCVLYFGAEFLR